MRPSIQKAETLKHSYLSSADEVMIKIKTLKAANVEREFG